MHAAYRTLVITLTLIGISGCSFFKPNLRPENEHALRQLVSSATSCYATKLLIKDLPVTPLFSNESGQCVQADLEREGLQTLYTDNTCTGDTLPFQKTPFKEYCKEIIVPNSDRLGNAAVWAGKQQAWTLNPPSALNISVLSIGSNHQPYMLRTRYKTAPVIDVHKVDPEQENSPEVVSLRGYGQCDLEMRIFKKDPAATNLKPLLAIHGGGWALRSSPYIGFESELSHFTEKGFVVFAPFYRLSSMSNGNYECNHAPWEEIVSDAEDALAWVKENGAKYGANNGKIYVMGGSAGGHLAAWISIHRKEDIKRTLLLYPATDFESYVQLARDSEDSLRGEGTIKAFLDIEDIDTIDTNSYAVRANSFPRYVEQDPASYPPMTFIHGVSDTLVPSSQSVRLCNAYSGDADNGPAVNDGGDPSSGTFSKEYSCGTDGKLFLIAEAEHTLDACIKHINCPTGSENSQQAAREAISKAIDWLNQ